jgi:autotransporter translocation and assembly factor TamB
MRFLWRALSIVLLLILLGVFLLVVLTRTPLVNRFLRDKVVAYAAANYRGALEIGHLEGSIWGSLRLEQVALVYQGKTILSIPRLSLEYSLVPVFWRTVNLRVALDSPQIIANRLANGKWNLLDALSTRVPTPPSSGKRSLIINVDSVRVSNGALQITPSGEKGPKYQVTNLDLDTGVTLPSSGMTVALRRFTANVAVPKMPLLYTAVSLNYDATAQPATVQLTDLDLRTQKSTISLSGDARLAHTPTVNLKVWLRRLAAPDIAQIYPASQLKSDLEGTVTLQGPESALHTIIALSCAGAALDGTADSDVTQKSLPYAINLKLSNANLQKIVRTNAAAGILDATVNAKGMGSNTAAANADIRVHGRDLAAKQFRLGTLDLTATAANKNAHLILTLAAPAGYLTARATTGISANPAYHLELAAQRLDVAKAGVAANARPTNLNLIALVDGHGLAPATADTSIRLRIDRSQLDQVTITGGLLDARVANNRANIARLHLDAADTIVDARGSAGLSANSVANLSYRVHSPNIKKLLLLAKMNGTGSLDINGTAGGPRSALRTRGIIELISIDTAGYSVQRGTTRYDLAITGRDAPSGKLTTALSGVKAGTELRSISLALDAPPGPPHAVSLRLSVIDNAGRRDLVTTHATYRPPSIEGQLTQMVFGLPTGKWHLLAPVDYKQVPTGISITPLQLQSGSRELVMGGTIAREGAQDFSLVLDRFDLAALQPLTPRFHEVHGMLSTKLRIAGTAAAPTIGFAAQASALGVGKQLLGNLNTTMNYSGERATFNALFTQNAIDHLTAAGSVPMSLSWSHGVKTKIGSTVDLTINSARLSLTQLGSLLPDQVRNFQGTAAVDLRVQGTLKQPQPTGSIQIRNVRGEIVPLGITVADSQVIIRLDPHAVRVETIEAHSGRGSIQGSGQIGLIQYAPSSLGVNLSFDKWPAINTQQYAATIGGNLTADGTVSRPRLQGRLEVLNGLIQPDIAFLSSTSNLSPDETIEVIQPGQHFAQPANVANPGSRTLTTPAASPQPSTFNNLAMKVGVVIHRNTWIRHPDAAVELQGNLDVDKDSGGPVRVAGEVRTVRGSIHYYNRDFTLKTGIITFTGGRKIDPDVDIDAQYKVTNYIIDIVVGGTASKPALQLKSQPELAQADILSLILFGRTTDALNQGQQASLQQQATKMATGVAAQQIGQAVASSMGLQGMGVTFNQTSSGNPAVGIGRYAGENTYISASQSVGGKGQKVSVQYFFLPWLSITTSSAADGSREIDLNLIKQY